MAMIICARNYQQQTKSALTAAEESNVAWIKKKIKIIKKERQKKKKTIALQVTSLMC